jgi:acid-sensing ion channel, other
MAQSQSIVIENSNKTVRKKTAAQAKVEHEKKEPSFREELDVLLNKMTMHCYRHLAQHDRSIWERWEEIFDLQLKIDFSIWMSSSRLMWFIIHVVNAVVLGYIILEAWTGFTENPLVTTLHDTIYPVSEVPFPGIVLCDNNRISRTAAEAFSRELWAQPGGKCREVDFLLVIFRSRKDIQQRNSSYFLEKIKYLGRLYDFDAVDELTIRELQEILDMYDNGADGNFDVMSRMRKVSYGFWVFW